MPFHSLTPDQLADARQGGGDAMLTMFAQAYQPKTPMYQHQRRVFDKMVHCGSPYFGIYVKPGGGKTKMALDYVSFLLELDLVRRIYIYCPAYARRTWEQQIALHSTLPHTVYEINSYESLSRKKGLPDSMNDQDVMILDESHALKNHKSMRTKHLRKYLEKNNPMVISMSGTVRPRDIRDMFMQAFLLNLPAGRNFSEFMYYFCTMKPTPMRYLLFLEAKNEDKLYEQFAPVSVFMDKAEFLDLPPKVYQEINYDMARPQAHLHNKLMRDTAIQMSAYLHDIGSGKAQDRSWEQQFLKKHIYTLSQICSGFYKTEDVAKEMTLHNIFEKATDNPKIQRLLDLLELLEDEQVVIYTAFVYEIQLIVEAFQERKISRFAVRNGRQHRVVNENALTAFKNKEVDYLVATVQSTAMSINDLVGANRIVYFNNTYDFMLREQSEDRIHRTGQDRTCFYYDIVCPGKADKVILSSLMSKNKASNLLFEFFKNLTTGVDNALTFDELNTYRALKKQVETIT